jgi:hypothetical protein
MKTIPKNGTGIFSAVQLWLPRNLLCETAAEEMGDESG